MHIDLLQNICHVHKFWITSTTKNYIWKWYRSDKFLKGCIRYYYRFDGSKYTIFTNISISEIECCSFKALLSLWIIYKKLLILKNIYWKIFVCYSKAIHYRHHYLWDFCCQGLKEKRLKKTKLNNIHNGENERKYLENYKMVQEVNHWQKLSCDLRVARILPTIRIP